MLKIILEYNTMRGRINIPCIRNFEWSVGDKKPIINFAEYNQFIVEASDKELTYIQQNFHGLPGRLGLNRTVIWRGDLAKFIIDNL